MKSKRVGKNIYLVYSPDEGEYYFEDRTPGDWKISSGNWRTEPAAMKAYRKRRMKWEEW